MPTLGNIQWVWYFHVFGVLGIFELAFMSDCYYLYGKFSGFTISMCLRNFGPNIFRVWFKLRKFLFSGVIINMNFVL